MSLAKSADASLAQSVDAKAPARFNSDWEQLWIGVALVAVTGFIPTLIGNSYWAHTFQLVNLYIAVAVFQNLLFVDAGQKSFGQGAILGVGAYGFAIAYGIHGFSFFVAALAGVLASVVGGLLFALPALRVQGFHLGFVTMSAGIVFPQLVVTLDKWTNGINGISIKIPWMTDPLFLGFSLAGLLAAVFPMIALALHYALRQSRLGRRMRVAAASPEAAQSLGVKPGLMRCIAFIIACAGTGVAGALYGPTVGFVNPSSFNIELSFVFFFAVVVGGRGQLLGPINAHDTALSARSNRGLTSRGGNRQNRTGKARRARRTRIRVNQSKFDIMVLTESSRVLNFPRLCGQNEGRRTESLPCRGWSWLVNS